MTTTSASSRTFSLLVLVFTLPSTVSEIYLYVLNGHLFSTGNLFAASRLALAIACVPVAFSLPRRFWMLCTVYFATFPLFIYFLMSQFPLRIYSGEWTPPAMDITPIILLAVGGLLTYLFVYRNEKTR